MRHFKAWSPVFTRIQLKSSHLVNNYCIKVKISQVLKMNIIFLFNMYLFSWLRKSSKGISYESEGEYVIPEQKNTMMKHYSLLNLCFPSLNAENKFSVYLWTSLLRVRLSTSVASFFPFISFIHLANLKRRALARPLDFEG